MSPACLAGKYHTKSRSAARARTELQQRGNTLLFPTVSSSHIHATHAASPSPHRITAPSRQSSTTTPGTRHRRDRLSYTNTEKHQHGKPGSWRAQEASDTLDTLIAISHTTEASRRFLEDGLENSKRTNHAAIKEVSKQSNKSASDLARGEARTTKKEPLR